MEKELSVELVETLKYYHKKIIDTGMITQLDGAFGYELLAQGYIEEIQEQCTTGNVLRYRLTPKAASYLYEFKDNKVVKSHFKLIRDSKEYFVTYNNQEIKHPSGYISPLVSTCYYSSSLKEIKLEVINLLQEIIDMEHSEIKEKLINEWQRQLELLQSLQE